MWFGGVPTNFFFVWLFLCLRPVGDWLYQRWKHSHSASDYSGRNLILRPAMTQESSSTKPTICLSMIVKDEAPVIERCLRSVKPWIDHWVIVDTGSSDGTQAMIRKFMADQRKLETLLADLRSS